MDIQSILGKLDQIEAPEKLASVKLPEKMQLTEADQLRVLSGQKHILTESKKEDNLKPKEKQKAIAKKEEDKPVKDKPVKESSDAQTAAREKFKAMVADKKSSKKDTKSGPAKKSVDKKDKTDKTKEDDKKVSAKKSTKKTVKESYEPKLTFKDMIRLVQESGGQQRIDPLDTELFEWANRVASTKFTDNTKKEVYAGLVYERMGGRFEMHDILSESFEEENEQDLEEVFGWSKKEKINAHPTADLTTSEGIREYLAILLGHDCVVHDKIPTPPGMSGLAFEAVLRKQPANNPNLPGKDFNEHKKSLIDNKLIGRINNDPRFQEMGFKIELDPAGWKERPTQERSANNGSVEIKDKTEYVRIFTMDSDARTAAKDLKNKG